MDAPSRAARTSAGRHPESCSARAPSAGARALLACAAVATGYANTLRVPFLLDDPQPDVPLDYSTRPLVWASFALNRALSGGATWSYHVFNALVHLLCGLLVYGVLRRGMALVVPGLAAARREGIALATALLWLAHPLQTAAITYLSQRAEALASLFYLLFLYAFLRAVGSARPLRWQLLALAALAVGFATKEIIATAPVLAFLLDAALVERGPLAALRRRAGFYAALAATTVAACAVFIAPILSLENSSAGLKLRAFGPLEYARTQPGVILHYLRLVLWPHPLCFDYAWPIAQSPSEYLLPSLAVAALVLAALVLCLRRSWIGVVALAFFLVLAPTSSFLPIQDPAFEHRMYLPLVAPLLLAVAAASALAARVLRAPSRLPALCASAALLAHLAITIRRNQDYRTPERLFAVTAAQVPHNARAHANWGAALLAAERTDEAIAELEEALRLDPSIGHAYLNLGKAHLARGDTARAIALMQQGVARVEDPRFRDALASALYESGDPAGAVPHFEAAVARNPGDAWLRYRLACALAGAGNAAAAEAQYEEALRLAPTLQEAHVNLAALLFTQGRTEEALAHALRAGEIAPDSLEELFGRGQVLRASGRFDEAVASFRAAIELAPERPEPRAGLAQAVCLKPGATQVEREEALAQAREAATLTHFEQPEILVLLAETQAALGRRRDAAETIERALALPAVGQNAALEAQLRNRLEAYGGPR